MTMRGMGQKGVRRRGAGLLDVMLAAAVSAIFSAGLLQLQFDASSSARTIAAADALRMVRDAGQQYMTMYAHDLDNTISAGSVTQVALSGTDSLESTGLLPANFSASFLDGQSIAFLIRRVAASGNIPDHFEGMVTTYGGEKIPDRQLGLSVLKMGLAGGTILSEDVTGDGNQKITGAYGGWSVPASDWSTGNVTPSSGHLMMTLQTVQGPISEFLDRYAVGDSDANTMHTSMYLNTNTISGVYGLNTDGSNLNINSEISIPATTDNPNGASVAPGYGRLVMWNGGQFCADDVAYCHFDISDDGGFYDRKDGWLTFTGNYSNGGLKMGYLDMGGDTHAGSKLWNTGAAQVNGTIQVGGSGEEFQNGNLIILNGSALSLVSTGGEIGDISPVMSGSDFVNDDGYWLQAYGSSGFAGVSADLIAASRFITQGNTEYYMIPNGSSYINAMNAVNTYIQVGLYIAGNLTVDGLLEAQNLYTKSNLQAGTSTSVDGTAADNLYARTGVTIGNNATIYENGQSSFGGLLTASNGYTIGSSLNDSATALSVGVNLNLFGGSLYVADNGTFPGSTPSEVNGNSGEDKGNVTVGGELMIPGIAEANGFHTGTNAYYGALSMTVPSDAVENVNYGVVGSSCTAQAGANGTTYGGPGTIATTQDRSRLLVCLSDNIWHQISWE